MKKLLGIVVLGLLFPFSTQSIAAQVKQVKFCQIVGGNWDVEINLEMYRKRYSNRTVDASICPSFDFKVKEISEKKYVAKKMEDINPIYSEEQHIKRIIAIRKPYLIHGLNTDFFDRKILKSYKKFLSEKQILLALSGKIEPKTAEKPKKKKPKKQTPDDNKVVEAAWGSGFFVSRSGHIITNYHVIEGCDIVKADYRGSGIELKTLAIDKMNDIAIVQGSIKPDQIYPVSNEDVSMLEEVYVAGYPLARKISSIVKTHKGVVTAVAGAGDNYSNFQTDATINQGNSGGPIINQKGNVVGIAVQTWVQEGVQGVHFGIKSSTLKTFANANGLKFQPPNNRDLSNKELGVLITNGTVFLECHLTIAKIKKMIAEANNRKAFYSEYK